MVVERRGGKRADGSGSIIGPLRVLGGRTRDAGAGDRHRAHLGGPNFFLGHVDGEGSGSGALCMQLVGKRVCNERGSASVGGSGRERSGNRETRRSGNWCQLWALPFLGSREMIHAVSRINGSFGGRKL